MKKIIGFPSIASYLGVHLVTVYRWLREDASFQRIIRRDSVVGKPWTFDKDLKRWKK